LRRGPTGDGKHDLRSSWPLQGARSRALQPRRAATAAATGIAASPPSCRRSAQHIVGRRLAAAPARSAIEKSSRR